jgi:hypothetical protein
MGVGSDLIPPADALKDDLALLIERMLNAATAFYQAGQRLSGPIAISPTNLVQLGAPPIVCFAFSIELYLKLLILITAKRQARGHELLELYDELDDTVKATCAAHYVYPDHEDLLREAIADISTTFKDWRYAHEKEYLVTSTETFERVGRCLHKAAAVFAPELVSAFDRSPPPVLDAGV